MSKCLIKANKEINRKFRKAFEYRHDEMNGRVSLVWEENNNVKMISNHLNILPFHLVTR